MHRNNLRWIAVVAAAMAVAGGGALRAAGGSGGVHHVQPGMSIQAAIDDAGPGDSIAVAPGVYRENLSIRTDGITLRGAGSGPQGTVLEPPVTAHASDCTEAGEVVGICIAGVFVQGRNELGTPVRQTAVSGFRVDGFSKFGIVAYNTVDSTISDNDVSHSGHFGIAAIEVNGVRLTGNHSHDNGQSGFYVADAAAADAVITGNTASDTRVAKGSACSSAMQRTALSRTTGSRAIAAASSSSTRRRPLRRRIGLCGATSCTRIPPPAPRRMRCRCLSPVSGSRFSGRRRRR
jgi:nitrous oxidase accessory protein NosD